MSDPQPSMTRTRWMAYIAFAHALYHMTFADQISVPVLYFDAFIISLWAIGRASLIDGLRIWKGKE